MFGGSFISGLTAPFSTSETPPPAEPSRRAPVVGLALGGGAARGWAHIGVLKTLAAAGIAPGVIVGTSIGAVAGGAFAANRLGELETFARALTRRSVLSLMDFRLPNAGLIAGERLRRNLEDSLGELAIEDLPVRFAAIATEIPCGHEVWLTRGRLSEAIRASYALPGIFVPVRMGNRWLVDGALVNPVPVSVARALGADLVIAINLHGDVFGRSGVLVDHGAPAGEAPADRRAPPGIATVMMDAFNITQDRIARSRLAGDPPDLAIMPKLGPIGLAEFHRADEAIDLGRLAAEKALPDVLEAVAQGVAVG